LNLGATGGSIPGYQSTAKLKSSKRTGVDVKFALSISLLAALESMPAVNL
jgi:hypothetical protein